MPRILIVTAAMGAGHTSVAQELALRLQRHGAETEVVDLLALAGRSGERVQRVYRMLLAHAPWVYDAAMRFWARWPRPMEWLVGGRSGPAEDALLGAVTAHRPDVIVSTYNLASQTLGRLAEEGAITAPIVTLVTDPGAHPYWISRGVTLHIAPLARTARRLQDFGAAHVVVAPPVLRADVHDLPEPRRARKMLDLPATGRIVLVSAGSWAAGRVERTVRALAGLPGVLVVVACGRDARLRETLAGYPGVRALEWTDKFLVHLAAASVVVDNAGGLTCWEALACGTPVVLFDPLPGHGRFNAEALEDSCLVRVARNREQLRSAVGEAARVPPTDWLAGPPAEDQILALARGIRHARA